MGTQVNSTESQSHGVIRNLLAFALPLQRESRKKEEYVVRYLTYALHSLHTLSLSFDIYLHLLACSLARSLGTERVVATDTGGTTVPARYRACACFSLRLRL